jgi:glutathione synthase/RimK-type ligase-like ATP-grasp enzyme
MRLAIHHRKGSFSERWIASCEAQQIPHTLVNCLETDIIERLFSVDGLLWHWSHYDQREQLVARHIITAAEGAGIVVFPSTKTCWHFDDKVAQKYLLEAVKAPLAPTHVFYDLSEALAWIEDASFPKVFKLRKGAGSSNVKLVRNSSEARRLAKQAFSGGFRPIPYSHDSAKRYRAARRRGDWSGILKRLPRTLLNIKKINQAMGWEKGYIYFQDFIPDNHFDTRVTIIGDRAFAFTRKVRPGDFRASGSGNIDYDFQKISLSCVQVAFDVTERVGSQSMAFDFVLASNNTPMIIEVSYCYDPAAVYRCEGYWNRELNWIPGHVWPQDAILEDLVDTLSETRKSVLASARITHQ